MPRAGSCPRRKPREPSDIIPRCRSLIPPCATQKREKVDDFYAARSRTIPPLPWSSFPPPFSGNPEERDDYRPPCPCCGGRMIIIEVFERRKQPRGPPHATATNWETTP